MIEQQRAPVPIDYDSTTDAPTCAVQTAADCRLVDSWSSRAKVEHEVDELMADAVGSSCGDGRLDRR